MPATLFGRAVGGRAQLVSDLTKAVGTRTLGAQRQEAIAGRIETALAPFGRGYANTLHDPTLGAPFASADNRLTVAQMGPGQPAENFPLGGEPRQMLYRVGWNFPTTPDSDRGVSAELLRTLSRSYFLLRRCIERRKSELCSFEWDIVPRERNHRRAREMAIKNADLIAKVRQFFAYPEAYYALRGGQWVRDGLTSWQDWLRACLEDVFVGDWLTLWPQMTYGGDLLGLRRVDGAHIKPLLDLDGRTPPPPMPAFQYYLYGAPRAAYAADELFYWPHNPMNTTPYGYSHVEQALVLLNMGIRFDMWNTAAFSDATVPMGLLKTPEKITPEQIQDIADYLNGVIGGNLSERQRIHPVPFGTEWQAIKPQEFNNDYAMYLIQLTCVALDVLPSELGFTPNRAALGGSGWAQEQSDQARQNRIAFAYWVQGKMTQIVHHFWGAIGGYDLEFRFTDLVREDSLAKWESNDKALRSGQMSLDEIVEADGGDRPNFGRMIETKIGIILPERGLFISGQGVLPLEAGAQHTPAPPPPEPSPSPDQSRPPGVPGSPEPAAAAKVGVDSGLQPYDLYAGQPRHVPGVVPYPPDSPEEGGEGAEADEQRVERKTELQRWQRRAIKDAKCGRAPGRAFSSDVLPPGWQAHIRADLGRCATPDQVRSVFAEHLKKADEDDGEDDRAKKRRKEEKEFILLYLALMRQKVAAAASTSLLTADDILRAWYLSDEETGELARAILDMKIRAYMTGYNTALAAIGQQASTELPVGVLEVLTEEADASAGQVRQTHDTAVSAQVDALTRDTAGIPDTERWRDVSEDLRKWLERRMRWRAGLIAATEAERAAARGYADAVKTHRRMALLRWEAVLDGRTCEYCRDQYGTVHGPGDWWMIPAHPNCRCQWVEADSGLPVSYFPSPMAAPGSFYQDPGGASLLRQPEPSRADVLGG